MPTMVRAVVSEADSLLAFLTEQRAGLRRSLLGLTEEQARTRPCSSELSLGGLVKHATAVERFWIHLLATGAHDGDDAFQMQADETISDLLRAQEAVAAETTSIVADLADLGRDVDLTGMDPILPRGTRRSARWILLHLIEETARHAGHADILRETLDGATAPELVHAAGDPLLT